MTRDEIIRLAREAGMVRTNFADRWDVHQSELEKFAALVATAERAKVVEWMAEQGYATGHGDTVADLLNELKWQVAEQEREACAKLCEEKKEYSMPISCPDGISGCLVAHYIPARREKTGSECAADIRARGKKC